ncbi:MAG: PGF-pre-PGF domain-containing protein [Candidatus Pacearchaeota archaeon]
MLAVLIFTGFVLADSGNLAPSEAEAGDEIQMLWFNVSTNVSGGNSTFLKNVTINLTGTALAGNITNITLAGNDSTLYFNDTAGDFPKIIFLEKNITEPVNFTLNFTLSSNATWNKTFQANVTDLGSNSSDSEFSLLFSNMPYNSSFVTINESTNPEVTPVEKESQTRTSITTDFSSSKCSDSGTPASGISTCVLSSSSGTVDGAEITGLSCGISYDITVTGTDKAANTASTTASLSTQACGGGGGGGTLPVGPSQKNHSFMQINPGVAAVVSDFNSEIGIRKITINVDNPVQNVKIVVTKYDGKPAEVAIVKSGSVYQYLEIDTENLESGFGDANVEFRVEKSWAQNNNFDREDVDVFRFNEGSSSWEGIGASFLGEDNEYYFYNAVLNDFSYFVISEKSIVEEGIVEGTELDSGSEEKREKRNLDWLWVLVVVLITALIFLKVRKKK